MTDLLSILHAAHSTRGSTLHPNGISLRTRRSIALPRIRASLLGPRSCGRPLLLLGVGVGSSIWLASHLPYLVHWTWWLKETKRVYLTKMERWIDGLTILLSKLCGEGLTWEIIARHSLVASGLMAIVCLLLLLRQCSHTLTGAIIMQLIAQNPVMWLEIDEKIDGAILEAFSGFCLKRHYSALNKNDNAIIAMCRASIIP